MVKSKAKLFILILHLSHHTSPSLLDVDVGADFGGSSPKTNYLQYYLITVPQLCVSTVLWVPTLENGISIKIFQMLTWEQSVKRFCLL